MATSKRLDKLFVDAQFCIFCGAQLTLFGSSTTDRKICTANEEHGTVYISGYRRNSKVAAVVEMFEQ